MMFRDRGKEFKLAWWETPSEGFRYRGSARCMAEPVRGDEKRKTTGRFAHKKRRQVSSRNGTEGLVQSVTRKEAFELKY